MKVTPEDKPDAGAVETLARLLEGESPSAIGPARIEELKASPEGDSALQTAVLARRLTSAGPGDGLDQAARDRVLRNIRGAIAPDSLPDDDKTNSALAGLRRAWSGLFAHPRFVMTGLAVMALAIGLSFLPARSVGELLYADAGTQLHVGDRAIDPPLLGQPRLARQTRIDTEVAGGALIDYRGGAYIALNADTSAMLDRRRGFTLDRGSAWFEVAKGNGRFEVTTRHVVVRVLGTAFQVDSDEEAAHITLFEGRIELLSPEDGRSLAMLKPGDRVSVALGVAQPAVHAPVGGSIVPEWVERLESNARRAHGGNLIPSLVSTESEN